jgi:hypothetical protein
MHVELDESKKNKAFKDSAHEIRVERRIFFSLSTWTTGGRSHPEAVNRLRHHRLWLFDLLARLYALSSRLSRPRLSPAPCWSSASVQGFLTSIAID